MSVPPFTLFSDLARVKSSPSIYSYIPKFLLNLSTTNMRYLAAKNSTNHEDSNSISVGILNDYLHTLLIVLCYYYSIKKRGKKCLSFSSFVGLVFKGTK
jgi:hypothetical protein